MGPLHTLTDQLWSLYEVWPSRFRGHVSVNQFLERT